MASRNHRVLFQRETAAADVYGNETDGTWADLFTVWGRFKPGRAREQSEAGRPEAQVAGVLTVRSSTDTRTLTAGDRCTIRGETYQIHAITNPDQVDRYLAIEVERGVAV